VAKNLSGNPWVKIWTQPRATIREIVAFDPKFRFLILAWVYGFVSIMHTSQNFSLGADLSLSIILAGTVVLALPLGILGISITSWLLQWTGGWIGGTASFHEIRAAVSWANVPNIINILMWLVLVGYFGSSVLSNTFAQKPFIGIDLYIVIPVFLIQFAVSIWSLVILITTLSEVQGFSGWKALLNLLIPIAMISVLLWILTALKL